MYTFLIKNLDCANCAVELEEALRKIEGIKEVSIQFLTQKLTIECDENRKTEIFENIKKIIHKKEPEVIIEEDRYE